MQSSAPPNQLISYGRRCFNLLSSAEERLALLHRINQSKLRQFSHCFKRCYFQIPHGSDLRSTNLTSLVSSKRKAYAVVGWRDTGFCDNVRFFAAPIQFQVKKKEESEDSSGPRLNEQITAREVRLVTEEGGHAIIPFREALARAKREEMDLVEVDRRANPPVCKIADYHKDKYKHQLKEKERVKSKAGTTLRKGGECKEVRFNTKTELKDLNFKADGIKRLMDRGYRVKCMAMGTENQDLAGLLSRMMTLIEDASVVESGPHVERKAAYAIVRHVKYGLPKKSGKIKIAKQDKAVEGSDDIDEDVTFETDESVVSDEEDDMEVKPPPRAERPQAPGLPQSNENRYQRSKPRSHEQGTRENRHGSQVPPNQSGAPMPSDARPSGASFSRNSPGPSYRNGGR